MKCEICGSYDKELLYMLPIRQHNGSLITIACHNCAWDSGAYCQKHHKPHFGFEDGSTACQDCIEEMIEQEQPRTDEWAEKLRQGLGESHYAVLIQAAEIAIDIVGGPITIAVLRFIATRARRENLSFQEVVDRALSEKTAAFIVPHMYPARV